MTLWDWLVLFGYIAGATWLGKHLSGKQQSVRDFFLGGRKLPWPAVAGSIIATEMSGVTMVGVAAIAYGGDWTYLQLWIGYILSRFAIGYVFVPAYYRQEIYSPYHFMGRRLGPVADRVGTGLFFVGGFLAQGSRLFLAALMLNVITGMGVIPAIAVVGLVSVAWTWMGGISTVVWTDVIQFGVMVLGGLAVTAVLVAETPGGLGEILRGSDTRILDGTLSLALPFTLWAGIIGTFFQGLASHGTDQMLAQRLLCCRDEASARKAIIASGVAVLLSVLMLGVGSGLVAYFSTHAMSVEQDSLLSERRDYILPIFVLKALPAGLKGLFFAAIFAAAASTGTSVLAAMGQAGLATFHSGGKEVHERRKISLSRLWILGCGIVLCGAAVLCSTVEKYGDILTLALAMSSYTYGPMLGMFLFALRPRDRDGEGLPWAVGMALLLVLALAWSHHEWVRWALSAGAGVLVGVAVWRFLREPVKLVVVGATGLLVVGVTFGVLPVKIAWPWYFPIGTLLTYGLAVLLGKKALAGYRDAPVGSAPS